MLSSEGESLSVAPFVTPDGKPDDAELVELVLLDVFLAAVLHQPQQGDVGPLGSLV